MSELPSKKITRLRQSGNLEEAWDAGVQAVKENPDDQYLKGAMFWVCYAFIKSAQQKIRTRSNLQNDEYIPNFNDVKEVEFYARCLIKLDVAPDDINYRSLLLISQKNLEYFPNLVLLLHKHSNKLFQPEDKLPYENEKGESASLMLKFARKVAKSWSLNEHVRQITIDDLCELLARTREEVKDKQNLIWLDFDESKCLIIANKFEQAKVAARKVARKKLTEIWALSLLAQTYAQEDLEAATALYSKALCCVQQESFALTTLKDFASVLAQLEYFEEASMCVKRALKWYTDNGYSIKSELETLLNQPWYNSNVNINLLQPFIEKHSERAMEYIAGERKQVLAIVSSLHKSGKGFHAYINKNMSVSIRLGLFKSQNMPSIGEYISVTLSSEDGSVIESKPAARGNVEGVKLVEGTLTVTHSGFGFIDDAFVPPHLIKPDMNGCQVSALAVLGLDKKKNKFGMKAISIETSKEDFDR